MRLLWLIPKAAPALLRHLVAYVDLASLDVVRAQREVASSVLISAVVAVCCVFAVFMGCLAVVAYTWDTPYRVAAIGWMGGGFLVAAIVAAVYRARAARARSPVFGELRREWQADRVLLEHLLSSNQD